MPYYNMIFVVFQKLFQHFNFSEGGFFKAHLIFPPEYPQKPPKMKFISEFWHPNGTYYLTQNYSYYKIVI